MNWSLAFLRYLQRQSKTKKKDLKSHEALLQSLTLQKMTLLYQLQKHQRQEKPHTIPKRLWLESDFLMFFLSSSLNIRNKNYVCAVLWRCDSWAFRELYSEASAPPTAAIIASHVFLSTLKSLRVVWILSRFISLFFR